jgi:hypothetical protein
MLDDFKCDRTAKLRGLRVTVDPLIDASEDEIPDIKCRIPPPKIDNDSPSTTQIIFDDYRK